MIGDGNIDVLTAKNAGIPSVKVKTGIIEECSCQADYEADDLLEAVRIVLNGVKTK